jgi:hypothetical protein
MLFHLLLNEGLHHQQARLGGHSFDGILHAGQDLGDGQSELHAGAVMSNDLAAKLDRRVPPGPTGLLLVLLAHGGGSFFG